MELRKPIFHEQQDAGSPPYQTLLKVGVNIVQFTVRTHIMAALYAVRGFGPAVFPGVASDGDAPLQFHFPVLADLGNLRTAHTCCPWTLITQGPHTRVRKVCDLLIEQPLHCRVLGGGSIL